jgi:hypothetical protein
MMAIGNMTPLMHWAVYVICTLFMASWPYRLWLGRKTVKGKFVFRKEIYMILLTVYTKF